MRLRMCCVPPGMRALTSPTTPFRGLVSEQLAEMPGRAWEEAHWEWKRFHKSRMFFVIGILHQMRHILVYIHSVVSKRTISLCGSIGDVESPKQSAKCMILFEGSHFKSTNVLHNIYRHTHKSSAWMMTCGVRTAKSCNKAYTGRENSPPVGC